MIVNADDLSLSTNVVVFTLLWVLSSFRFEVSLKWWQNLWKITPNLGPGIIYLIKIQYHLNLTITYPEGTCVTEFLTKLIKWLVFSTEIKGFFYLWIWLQRYLFEKAKLWVELDWSTIRWERSTCSSSFICDDLVFTTLANSPPPLTDRVRRWKLMYG